VRQRLGNAEDDVALLCCGTIRPHKNFDGVIEALCDPRCAKPLLIVAGQEPGNAADPLEHTRQMVEQFGLRARVRCCQNSSASPKWRSCLKPADTDTPPTTNDVIMLPYAKGYGSGLLLQAMTFGKYIVSSRIGGADEYLQQYPRAVLLEGASVSEISAGIAKASGHVMSSTAAPDIPELEWTNIAADLLRQLPS
jgi:glycosyltransferase involved in cell wall biosynthesis